MITATEVVEAERNATVSERRVIELEADGAHDVDLFAADRHARYARLRADRLVRDQHAEQVADAMRDAAEADAAGEIAEWSDALERARTDAADAIARAERAQVEALALVHSYNCELAAVAEALDGRGLALDDATQHRPTGAGRSMARRPFVRLRGAAYRTTEPGAVAAWSAHRVAEAVLGYGHAWTLRTAHGFGSDELDRTAETDGLVASVPPVTPMPEPTPEP